MLVVNAACKTAKKLQLETERYWILEYIRRQPRNRKYCACLMRLVRNMHAIVLLTEVCLFPMCILNQFPIFSFLFR